MDVLLLISFEDQTVGSQTPHRRHERLENPLQLSHAIAGFQRFTVEADNPSSDLEPSHSVGP
jgi:hypothetical protein